MVLQVFDIISILESYIYILSRFRVFVGLDTFWTNLEILEHFIAWGAEKLKSESNNEVGVDQHSPWCRSTPRA